jgi:hypothetical protein
VSERYRKWGRTVRFERDTIIEATEQGEAIENSIRFEAHPYVGTGFGPSSDGMNPVTTSDVEAIAKKIRSLIDVNIERLNITAGVTEHEF